MNVASRQAFGVALGGLIALAAAMGIGRFVYTPILPFMLDGLGLSQAQAGLIASANFLGYLVGALAAASSALPGGQRRWFLGALAVSALSTGAMGLTSSVTLFLAFRFIGGVASAFVLVFSSALVLERLTAAGRPGLAAVHFAGVGAGIALSAVLVSWRAATGADWDTLWLWSGALSICALVAVVGLVPARPEPVSNLNRRQSSATDRRLIALIVAYGLFGFGYVITATFINALVRLSPEISSVEPVIWLVVGLAAIPSVALWSWIARILGNARGFALACLVEAIGVAMSVLAESAVAVAAAAALLGGTFMGITALGLVYARKLSSGNPRRSLALMTAAFGFGQMIGPSFAGFAYDVTGSFVFPSLAAATALVVAAALVFDSAKER